MKAWAVGFLLLVGCYQPSASERYNIESETLDRLNAQVGRLLKLKESAEGADPPKVVTAEWDKRRSEYDKLVNVAESQAKKVSELGLQLNQ